jgi:hypothetical protein
LAVASSPVWRDRVATSGLSLTSPELAGKRLELIREAIPGLRQLAIMANADYPPAVRELDEIETAAHPLGIETIALKIRQAALLVAWSLESLGGGNGITDSVAFPDLDGLAKELKARFPASPSVTARQRTATSRRAKRRW